MVDKQPPSFVTEGAGTVPDFSSLTDQPPAIPPVHRRTTTHVVRDAKPAAATGRPQPRQQRPAIVKVQKPPRIKRTPDPKVVLPEHGWPVVHYSINKLFGHADRVPKLGQRDQMNLLKRELKFYVDNMQITISFTNFIGGASKTTTALYIGLLIAEVSEKTTCLMPATKNTATSTTALNAGIRPGKTVTVSQLNRLIKSGEVSDYRSISARVPRANKLLVIAEDTREQRGGGGFGPTQFVENAEFMHSKTDTNIFDHGNDDVEPGSIVYEAARRSDVIVFTTTVSKPTTLVKLVEAIGNYMDLLSYNGVKQSAPRYEAEISFQEKAAQSVVVISGLKRGEKAEDYHQFTMARLDRKSQTSIGFEGAMMGIPEDPYLVPPKVSKTTADDIDRLIIANPKKINKRTKFAYYQLAIAIYKKAMLLRGTELKFDPHADL